MALLGSVKQSHRGPNDQLLHRKGACTVALAPFPRTTVTEPLFRWEPTISHVLPTLYGPLKKDF